MPSLAELQRSFGAFLAAAPGQGLDERLTGAVRDHGLATARRLAVYKNNVYARLIEALVETYPAVVRLVGEDFFRFTAREFIVAHPSRERTLIRYGDGFAVFLEAFEPAASVPYLADVARLEYLYLEAYHAAEADSVTPDRFETLVRAPSTGLRITLHPSARLMSSRFPVSRIWEINVRDEPIESKVDIAGDSEHLLVIRPRATVEVRRVSAGAFAALAALRDGLTYAEALRAGTKADPGTDVPGHLRSLAAGQTFVEKEAAHGRDGSASD